VTAYWTWAHHGWLKNLGCLDTLDCDIGAIDYAGGGPVHIASGVSGLAFCIFNRIAHKEAKNVTQMRPHNITLVFLGTVLLWLGWYSLIINSRFAFNGGSALSSTPRAAMAAFISTVSASTAGLTWMAIDYFTNSRKLSGISFWYSLLAL
jgi:Amt family ammonium transporter